MVSDSWTSQLVRIHLTRFAWRVPLPNIEGIWHSFQVWINFVRLLGIPCSYIRDMTPVKYHMNLAPCWNFLFSALSDRFRLAGVFVLLL